MQLRMWSYDLAREQAPSLDHLRRICRLTQDAGYNALGLYLEHRFAYPSVPWAHGGDSLTPETAQTLIREFPSLQIIPLVNLLGHFEGLLYSLGGQRFAEHYFKGMQACPSNPDFLGLAEGLLKDVLNIFNSEIVMIGGDETWQLGQCSVCQARVEAFEAMNPGADGKALLYADHFARLAELVLEAGRRPAIWGDMFADHPSALPHIPTGTIIFDWQYFQSPRETSRQFFEAGHEVVFCPSILTYSAPWCHLPQSELNVREHIAGAKDLNAKGVCITTWEMALFGSYETVLPAIKAAGEMMESVPASSERGKTPEEYRATKEAPSFMRAYLKESETYEEWARLMGIELQSCGGIFSYGGLRSPLKARFLLYSNPFLLWLRNREDLCGIPGDKALDVLDRAIAVAPDSAARGISEFVRIAIEFARAAETAHMEYSAGHPGRAVAALTPARASFDDLARIAKATHLRIGGSLADIERCRVAKEHVERVMRRLMDYGDGSLGYLPSFETITNPKFVPHDQGNWWLINSWANE